MTFNSLQFLLFLPLMVAAYYALPHRWRWVLLLAGSYYFYMCWRVEYIVLIVASTMIDFWASGRMEKTEKKSIRKSFLLLSIVSNLGLLFAFKYYHFATNSSEEILSWFNVFYHFPDLEVLLPVGISFYTFQTLSYTIDVYKRKLPAEKHLGYFALYVAYFPQLVAGPIERYDRLAPQLQSVHKPEYENFSNGFRLLLYGLFVKMVIADNLAVYVQQIYDNPGIYNSYSIITGLLFYSFQIYADFYGYSIMAIGSAMMIGVNLMDNFKTPYLARNISEFWQRWHISLSTWFRDYLYIPLGGNRVKIPRWALNIFLVFAISGLWHGASWNFVIWGSIFGLMFLIERFFQDTLGWVTPEKWGIKRVLGVGKTFLIVSIAWIFFRSSNLAAAKGIFVSIFNNSGIQDNFHVPLTVWILFGIFLISDILLFNNRFDKWCSKHPMWLRWSIYSLLIFAVMAFGGTDNQPFIYFQF